MRTLFSVLFGLLFALSANAEPSHIGLRFAPLPMESREQSLTLYQSLVERIQQSGHPVEVRWHSQYDAVLEDFIAGNIDLAVLGPLGYIRLRERFADAHPLVRFREPDGRDFYHCTLVVFAGDTVSMVSVPEQSLGLTQPLSTCGYLGTAAILRDHGIDMAKMDYKYMGNHDDVALAVIAGEVGIGGVKDSFASKYAPLGLRVLATSSPIPALVMVGNAATLDSALLEKLRAHLLSTPEVLYRQWGNTLNNGMLSARDSDYDSLRQFGDWRNIPRADLKHHEP